jgi:hypothetical protein
MAQHCVTQLSHVPIEGDQEAASTHGAMRNEESLSVLTGPLAEVAHALRQAAANPSDVDDIESVAVSRRFGPHGSPRRKVITRG